MEVKTIYNGKTTIKITKDVKEVQKEIERLEKSGTQYIMYRRKIKRFHGDKEYRDSFVFEILN